LNILNSGDPESLNGRKYIMFIFFINVAYGFINGKVLNMVL